MRYWVIIGEGGGLEEVKAAGSKSGTDINSGKLIFPADDLMFTVDSGGESEVFLKGQQAEAPDVFLLWGHYNEAFDAISARLISMGSRSVNDIDGKRIACSKLLTGLALEKAGIPQPKFMILNGNATADMVEQYFGLPVVIKPSDGAQGEGVTLIEDRAALEQKLQEVNKLISEGHAPYLAQEYISASRGQDIRVYVFDYKVINAISRQASNPNEFRSNVHLGGQVSSWELDEDAKRMCEAAARAVGLRICGLDLLVTGSGYVVNEINCTPGMPDDFLASDTYKNAIKGLVENTLKESTT